MFTLTEAAREELQNRLNHFNRDAFIRLQMRKSCFMKVKVTLEKTQQASDTRITKDGLPFIIDEGECHYFNNKILDYMPDQTGFKQFEVM